MAYTFGGGTGDDVTWQNDISIGGTAGNALICGWWYPTTLTATRGLWSAGNINGAEIDTTTDELRLRIDATTDGQWTTTGVDLVADEWKFLAFLNSNLNTGAATAWRVWAGTVDTPPVEATVSVDVARSGNSTASTAFYIGNKGTGTVAFQGDIADVVYIASTVAAGVTTNPFFRATNGTITQAEADLVYERYVLPLWSGSPDAVLTNALLGTQATQVAYWSGLTVMIPVLTMANLANNTRITSTVTNGATPSVRRGPRPLYNWRIAPSAPRR